MTIENTSDALAEIRKIKDLKSMQEKPHEFCNKHGITPGQLNFLLAVVAAEGLKQRRNK